MQQDNMILLKHGMEEFNPETKWAVDFKELKPYTRKAKL